MKEKRFSIEQAKQIGDALGIDWSKFGVDQFRMGLEVELEHGTIDPETNRPMMTPFSQARLPQHISKNFRIITRNWRKWKKKPINFGPKDRGA